MTDRVRLLKNMIEGGYITREQVKKMRDMGEISFYECSDLHFALSHKEREKMRMILRGGFTELHLYPNRFLKGCFHSCDLGLNVKCYFRSNLIKDMVFGSFGKCEVAGYFDNLKDEPENDIWLILDRISVLSEEDIGDR